MTKRKRKLTAAERAERDRRKKEFMTIFINGKQKRVRRSPTIEAWTLMNSSAAMQIRSGRLKTKCGRNYQPGKPPEMHWTKTKSESPRVLFATRINGGPSCDCDRNQAGRLAGVIPR